MRVEGFNGRTPQQNGVAERKNRTLIEAARTMLADSKLPTTFWAEAVNTACYVQNRVLVIKPHNKTPYELFLGRKPALSFMRPFGCPVTILNTIDHLGKFDGKADEGFFVGYSTNSKAFRVFNSRTRIVEENLHVKFSEDTPNIAGSGPNWLFDIDALTKSMNYEPVVTGNQSNGSAGTKACDDAGKARMETEEKKDAKDPENEDKNNAADENIVYGCDDDLNMPNLEEIVYSYDDEGVDTKSDMTNLDTHILVSPTPTTRIHKDHPLKQIIRDIHSVPQTRRMTKNVTEHEVMQEELLQFKLQQVWTLMDLPHGKRAIGTKWVYKNKKDERGIIIKNKARIEAISLFLAYASFKDFVVYQIDVKSAFLYGKIKEEFFVCQPPGFEDPEFPDKVYKVEKALCDLHQAPKACQDKYVDEILKFGFSTVKTASTPMETSKPLLKDAEAEDVDVHLYRSMIGSLMYLITSRPDIMFDVCACARFQVTPKVSHLHAVKKIFRFLKGQPKLGLWYPKDSPFDLEAYTGNDYAGASLYRKSTIGDSVMSSASSAVTYTSVYTDSEPGRPVAPPSPDYVPGPEHPPSPDYVPGPEHPPSPVEVPYVPEPEYPEYLAPSDAEAPLEDQPLPIDASPTALSPGYEDPEEDPEEDHADYPTDGGDDDDEPSNNDDDDTDEEPFEDEDDDEEEEEHLALADSSAVPVVDPVPSAGDTEAFETDESAPTPRSPQIRIPFAQTRLRRARKTVRLEPPMSPSMEARIAEYAAAPAPPSPPPSPLSPWSPPLSQIPLPPLPPPPSSLHLPPPVPTSLPLPSSPLPPLPVSLFIPLPVDHREDILLCIVIPVMLYNYCVM
ncbi:ribonuclease H-like domain-containing protein [Tanacetum coccineum]|uniref:Ribonuclease H-like domain-containing protein n=1 Tax=Tanacetum coccineum TaxID=301880 RepID=A0ABQ5FC60_9ASTR